MRPTMPLAGLAALALAGAAHAGTHACAYTGGAATLSVPGRPFAAIPSADGCWLFVSSRPAREDGAIYVLQNEGGVFRLAGSLKMRAPGGMALTHDDKTLVVADDEDVAIVDVAELERGAPTALRGYIPEGRRTGAIYVAVSRDDRLAFVSEEWQGRLTVIDLARARAEPPKSADVIGRAPQGLGPVGLALSADGTRLYATNEVAPPGLHLPDLCENEGRRGRQAPGLLTVVDVAKAAIDPQHALVGASAAGCSPVRVAISPDGATVWVAARGSNQVLSFPAAAVGGPGSAPATAWKVGRSPVGLAVRPDGAEVWVADSDRFSRGGQGGLSRIRPAEGEVAAAPSGQFPRELAFLPDGVTLVVAQFGSGAIQFVPTR